MIKVKITAVGNSMGLSKMKASKGDTLYLVESPEGYTLTPYEENFESQIKVAETVMKKYRNALHKLAK